MQPPRLPRRLTDRIWQRGGRPLAEAVAASAAGLIFIEFVVLVVWGADTGSSTGPAAALRVGADLWLAAHGTTLRLPDGIIAFRPLGLALFPLAAALSAAHRRASAAPLQSHAVLNRMPLGRTPLGRVSLNRVSLGRMPLGRVSRLRPARFGGGRPAASGANPGDSRGGRCRSDGAPGVPWRAVAGDVIGVVGAQTLFVVVVAVIVRTHSVRPTPGSAALGTVAFGIPAALLGALAGRHRLRTAWRMLPVMLRVPLLSGAAAFMALLAAAAFGVALVLAATEPEVAAAERSLDVGALGGLGLTATQLALLPNLVLWGLSYALGPGFRTGSGLVRADVVRPADLPDLPVLAALPPSALPRPGWLVLALVPVVAGVVLAVMVHRASLGRRSRARLLTVLLGAVVCGALVGLAVQVSMGQVGTVTGQGNHYGPSSGWLCGLIAGGETALVGLLLIGGIDLAARRAERPFVADDAAASSWWRRLQPSGSWSSARLSRRHP
ncbi:hypothetical protein CcI156_00075 [Frankia sp. CcI156]|uniref:Uncharacterized protein n=2 Tax=Frankia TaxID=1854 RepID=Q2JFA4_FRACC|nr:DUF6350 family protein [Frankia sp. B2]ABD10038.1 hypothetical protein Francci3_0654 [Frankia casuarinae]OHV51492.1 hypothetical protein CgIS1_03215 [Frankia sp. CgIS1]ONH29942.1 hypothetical protein CcI156_00075 [Frankia sp. CcI156]TFE35548.1 hypothetical protein E0F15_00095 [Frankia sp. B2]